MLSSLLFGILPFGPPYAFRQATERAVDSAADLRWGPDRKGFRRLVHPNGICLTGLWQITEDTGYSGYFRNGRRALVVGRYSTIEREYRAKLDDLRHNYALRVTVEWIQALDLYVPVQRFDVLIRRRKGERVVRLDWHPLVKMAEPPLCEAGLGLDRVRLVCNDKLHLTDLAGQAPCPSCGKPFCRACSPAACPRCGQASAARATSVANRFGAAV